jgi:hypothetical protein
MTTPLGGLPQPPFAARDEIYRFNPQWAGWFSIAQNILQAVSSSGTTATRPTKGLYIGQMYYDTTLGLPVWVHAISPAIIWHNAAGGVA